MFYLTNGNAEEVALGKRQGPTLLKPEGALSLFLLLLLALGPRAAIYAQADNQRFIDSMEVVLRQAAGVTEQIAACKAVIDQTLQSNQPLAKHYIEELQLLAAAAADTATLAYVQEKEASLFYLRADYQQASEGFQSACRYYEAVGLYALSIMACTKSGVMLSLMGKQADAGAVYRAQLAKARAQQLKPQQAYINNQLGTLYHYQGISDSAIIYYDISAEMYSELADTANLLRPLFNKAVLLKRSDPEESLATYKRVYDIRERQGAIPEMIKTLQAIADVQENNNELVNAFQSYQQAYRLCKSYDNKIELPNILTGLASLKMDQYDYEEALTYAAEAVKAAQVAGQAASLLNALSTQASAWYYLGDKKQALKVLEEVLSSAAATGFRAFSVQAWVKQALILTEMGEPEQAGEALREAEAQLDRGVGKEHLLFFKQTKALWALRVGRYDEASTLARESYQSFMEVKRYGDALRALEVLLEAYEGNREYLQAIALLGDYRWLADTVNQIRSITDLKVQNQEFEFELEKQELQAERAKREAVLQAESSRNLTIALAAALLGLMGVVFAFYSRRQRQIIQQQRDDLEGLNQTKDQLFSILGHDLRGPAMGFRGIAKKVNYLLGEQNYEGLQKFGRKIEEDAGQLLHLVENLLHWSINQQKGQQHRPVDIHLRRAVQDTLAFFIIRASAKGIALDDSELQDIHCHCDRDMLGVILRNLLDNAIKFTPEGGRVRVWTEQDGPAHALLCVADTGPGLPAAIIAQIEAGEGLKTSTPGTAQEKGFGLGLQLVFSLAQANKTPVGWRRSEDGGALFTIRIPLAA